MENNNNNINFSADENIVVVEAKKDNGGKKLPVIIAICLLAAALIAGILIFALGEKEPESNLPEETATEAETTTNPYQDLIDSALSETITDTEGNTIRREDYVEQLQQQLEAATTQLNQYVGSESPNEIVENSTSAQSGTVQETTTANTQQVNKAEAQIKAFFDRKCYIQGALYSGNAGDPLSISFDGDNFEALTNLDGIEISMMKLDGAMYIKRPALNQYVEFTDSVMKFMGFEEGELNFSFGETTYETMKSKLVKTYDVTINGKDGVCYLYKSDTQQFRFYSENGELRQIEIYDAEGELVSQIAVSYFSTSIPADQLTLKGYTKTGLGTIFADVLNE